MKEKKNGLIIVFTGNGKGKTTAALGMAFRAIGWNHKIIVIQFIKGTWEYGELRTAKRLHNNIEIIPMGEGFTWLSEDREKDVSLAMDAWAFSKEKIISGNYDMVILDEINLVIHFGFIDANEVATFLKNKPEELHIVLTGRNAHPEILEIADLITEMNEIKHPYKVGIKAQKGVEF